MKIQKVDYTINNYSKNSNQNLKRNPTFGKLIIGDDYIPTDILQATIKNEELKKMVKMFHKIGKDIKLSYDLYKIDRLHLFVLDKDGSYEGIIASFYKNTCKEPDISEKINKLFKGFAEETFNNYLKKRQNEVNDDSLRQEVLNSFDSFNKSLD